MSDPATIERRPGATSLRDGAPSAEPEVTLDPANQSLADALRITFRILQLMMALLVVAYILTGFQAVKESESGLRLLFGAVRGDTLSPGFHFSLPRPFGEIRKIDTGAKDIDLNEAFMPRLEAHQRQLSIEDLAKQAKFSLKPGEDGSLLTSDGNIAHTRWYATYRRTDPRAYADHVNPDDERAIVEAAIKRGVVQAVACTPIDDLLKQGEATGTVADHAKRVAQRTLDDMRSGLTIEQLKLREKTPPLNTLGNFNAVQAAVSKAEEAIATADSTRQTVLNTCAGRAVGHLIERIDAYEAALRAGQDASTILEEIFAVMEGREVVLADGRRIERGLISGDVVKRLNEARQYRSSIVSRRSAQLAGFRAKHDQYKSNPAVFVQREWSEALARFMSVDTVEIMLLPRRSTGLLEVAISRDPEILKALDRAQKEMLVEEARLRREAEQRAAQFRTDTSLIIQKAN